MGNRTGACNRPSWAGVAALVNRTQGFPAEPGRRRSGEVMDTASPDRVSRDLRQMSIPAGRRAPGHRARHHDSPEMRRARVRMTHPVWPCRTVEPRAGFDRSSAQAPQPTLPDSCSSQDRNPLNSLTPRCRWPSFWDRWEPRGTPAASRARQDRFPAPFSGRARPHHWDSLRPGRGRRRDSRAEP